MQHPLHPTGRPVDEFFGRRYLRCNELIAMGLIPNRVTLRRLVRDGLFPSPLRLSPRVLLWDSTEIAALLEQLAAERDKKMPDGESRRANDGLDGTNNNTTAVVAVDIEGVTHNAPA